MFLLPCIALGLLFALALGGRPSRLAEVRFRLAPLVLVALGTQLVLFTRLGEALPGGAVAPLHVGSYVLLLAFAAANLRLRPLALVFAGLLLNATAIAVNGGTMPVSRSALATFGVGGDFNNISAQAHRLGFLGDVFAVPPQLPVSNVFSFGDILIGLGAIAFIVLVSTQDGPEPALQARRLLSPFRIPSYRLLAAGKLVSHAGDWLTVAALMGWIYETTGSTAQTSLLLLVRLVPPIVGGGLAAVVVDRLPKHRLLAAVELARGLALGGALVAVLSGSRAGVLAALAVSGGLAAISNAAVPALLPGLLPAEDLPAANAGVGVAKDLAMAAGAAGGGVALATVGVTPALAVDLGTFALAFLIFCFLRIEALPPIHRAEREHGGFRYLLARPPLLLLVLSFAAATLATGLANATFPSLFSNLGLGPGGYGFAIAALAVGLAAGQAVVGLTRVGEFAGRWIAAGLLTMTGLFGALALGRHAPTALVLVLAIGIVDGTTDVLYDTVVQRRADPNRLGAIFGSSTAIITATMLAGVAVAPLAGDLVSPAGAIGASAVVLVLAAALALAAIPDRARLTIEAGRRLGAAPTP
jgi:hypothetical protein